ncbi:MAG: metalloregulator ArsR/SmtB family transcription factor [Verrucomicrobia subdivision 3 bacterium]|nr:metalloregulator ArsR/SmtB family transcription factor [Limisphaerales bacterium]
MIRTSLAMMVAQAECIRMLKALADETRWQIVRELLERTLTISELTRRLGLTQYNVSKHVRILREAGIVTTEKEGKNLNCTVDPGLKQRIARNKNQLDLGCCTFRFD